MKHIQSRKTLLPLIIVAGLIIPLLQSFTFQDIGKGESVYERKCDRCHGEDGAKGGRGAENLKESRMSDAEIIKIITEGKRKMPGFKDKLSAEDIKSVSAYIKTLRK